MLNLSLQKSWEAEDGSVDGASKQNDHAVAGSLLGTHPPEVFQGGQ
jgi:hypothetical protein